METKEFSMKDFDNIFKEMDKVFEQADKTFAEADKLFKNMDKFINATVARKREVGPWKEWYAWRPVKVKGKRVWLKKVYRRCINTYVDHDDWKRWEYGNVFDVIKEASK